MWSVFPSNVFYTSQCKSLKRIYQEEKSYTRTAKSIYKMDHFEVILWTPDDAPGVQNILSSVKRFPTCYNSINLLDLYNLSVLFLRGKILGVNSLYINIK